MASRLASSPLRGIGISSFHACAVSACVRKWYVHQRKVLVDDHHSSLAGHEDRAHVRFTSAFTDTGERGFEPGCVTSAHSQQGQAFNLDLHGRAQRELTALVQIFFRMEPVLTTRQGRTSDDLAWLLEPLECNSERRHQATDVLWEGHLSHAVSCYKAPWPLFHGLLRGVITIRSLRLKHYCARRMR